MKATVWIKKLLGAPAVLNGRGGCRGEGISKAALVAVDSEHAFVAKEAQTNGLASRR